MIRGASLIVCMIAAWMLFGARPWSSPNPVALPGGAAPGDEPLANPLDPAGLRALRKQRDDLAAVGRLRQHGWLRFREFTGQDPTPDWTSWFVHARHISVCEFKRFSDHGAVGPSEQIRWFDCFAANPATWRAESRPDVPPQPEPPSVVAYPRATTILYNQSARDHIQNHELCEPGTYTKDIESVELFPRPGAITAKLIWWPVAHDQLSALPYWIAPKHPAGANDFPDWDHFVAVESRAGGPGPEGEAEVQFYSRYRKPGDGDLRPIRCRVVARSRFYSVLVGDLATGAGHPMLAHIRKDFAKLHQRPLSDDDFLLLVGMHLAIKELDDWTWMTLWWHPASVKTAMGVRPGPGVFAAGTVWENYLLDATLGALEVGESPRPVYNPYLEAAHPGGALSNCFSCHQFAARNSSLQPRDMSERKRASIAGPESLFCGEIRLDYVWSLANFQRFAPPE